MRLPGLFLAAVFAAVSTAAPLWAADEEKDLLSPAPAEQKEQPAAPDSNGKEPAPAVEEEEPDFSNLRDPFVPQLPKVKIVQTPVEPAMKNIDNDLKSLPEKSTTPAVPTAKPVLPEMHVQGIVWGGPKPQAIINGLVVEAGDVVVGAKVKSIRKSVVSLDYQGERFHVGVDK